MRLSAAVAGAGAILLAASVAGCSGGGGSPAGGTVSGTVTVAAVPGVDNVPLYLAQKGGMFHSAGVNVEIRNFSSVTQEVTALVNGSVDIAAGDYGPFLYTESQEKSPEIKIVDDGYDAASGVLEIVTLPGSGISSPQDLEGKVIAAPSSGRLQTPPGTPDSLATAAATSVLRSYGVDMATVTWDPMAQGAEVAALRHHQVAAILVTEPYVYQAQSQLGATEVLDACSGATAGLPLSGYFAMNVWSNQNKTAVADFQSAMAQAQAQAATTGPVQSSLPGYTGMTKLEASVVTLGSYPTTTDANSVQRVAQMLSDEGVLSHPVAVSKQIIERSGSLLAPVLPATALSTTVV